MATPPREMMASLLGSYDSPSYNVGVSFSSPATTPGRVPTTESPHSTIRTATDIAALVTYTQTEMLVPLFLQRLFQGNLGEFNSEALSELELKQSKLRGFHQEIYKQLFVNYTTNKSGCCGSKFSSADWELLQRHMSDLAQALCHIATNLKRSALHYEEIEKVTNSFLLARLKRLYTDVKVQEVAHLIADRAVTIQPTLLINTEERVSINYAETEESEATRTLRGLLEQQMQKLAKMEDERRVSNMHTKARMDELTAALELLQTDERPALSAPTGDTGAARARQGLFAARRPSNEGISILKNPSLNSSLLK